jgi:phytoene/squalene synthetase
LQLANFWQDVAVDLGKDRIYIPLEVLRRHGSSESEVVALRFSNGFRDAMKECVDRAQTFFDEGLPLARLVDGGLSLDIDLFSRGGMKVLQKIRQQGYNVLSKRPAVSKMERVGLLVQALGRLALRRAA